MKVGDRDTPGSRIFAEREFREDCQVMVATEAAGEGINLQFCWLMVNYDIPWNPVRLEQRMGRIHRYGQEKDCLILNFVAPATREGRVMQKLFERIRSIEDDLDPQRTGKVFNVLGDVFPANQLERMLREMYARNLTEEVIKGRIVEQVDTDRFRRITHSTLEGLARRELNLGALVGRSAEARERRLVPEVIEDFFCQAGPLAGVHPKETRAGAHVYRLGRVPRTLWSLGERLEPRFGKLGREYRQVVFDKELLKKETTAEWVTPGHPLFEVVREDALERAGDDLRRGCVFYDLRSREPYLLDVFSAAIKDGRGNPLHRKLFVVQSTFSPLVPSGSGVGGEGITLAVKQPTIFLDLALAPRGTPVPDAPLPDGQVLEQALIEKALNPFLAEVTAERRHQVDIITRHVDISLNEMIHRQSLRHAELSEAHDRAPDVPLNAANLKQSEDRLDELNGRLERRREELEQEGQCAIGDIQHIGRAWVLPHPERASPDLAAMVPDAEIERIAVRFTMDLLKSEGWQVESVETENRGFDLIARKPHPDDPKTAIDVRFVEVKGRAAIGEVILSDNEYRTAVRLRKDYWLYAVFNCATKPQAHIIQDPARLGWEPLVKVEQYYLPAGEIVAGSKMP